MVLVGVAGPRKLETTNQSILLILKNLVNPVRLEGCDEHPAGLVGTRRLGLGHSTYHHGSGIAVAGPERSTGLPGAGFAHPSWLSVPQFLLAASGADAYPLENRHLLMMLHFLLIWIILPTSDSVVKVVISCQASVRIFVRLGPKAGDRRNCVRVRGRCGEVGEVFECRCSKNRVSDGYRFSIRPNCALSWRVTKLVVLFFSGCLAVVGVYFAALGAWIVLPFAGLELLVLAAGFYLSALAGHTREVVEIEGPVLRVLRGRRQLREVAGLPVNWTRVELRRDPRGWYPSRLLLCCHGKKGIEVGAQLVEAEREELAVALSDKVGFDRPRLAPSAPGKVPAEIAQARTRQACRWCGRLRPHVGRCSRPRWSEAAGCTKGAYPNK